MISFPPELAPLLGLVTASVSASGVLLQANAGFLRLIETAGAEPVGQPVAPFFIQPDFASLLKLPVNEHGEIYAGLLTLGDYAGKTRTLRARVWHAGEQLQLLADFDITELEHVNDTVLELNRSYAQAQLELAQTNFKLKQSAAALQQSNAELKATNTRLALAQSQLLQSEKLASIGLLAAGVAHEINNPIGFVNANFSTLKRYVANCLEIIAAYEAAQTFVGNVQLKMNSITVLKSKMDWAFIKDDVLPLLDESQEGLDRVKRIVLALNDFARTDQADVWRTDDIHQGIESTLSVFWSQIKHRCELRKEFGDLPAVECVQFKLNQVWLNLLQNAAQAIEGQGLITIRTGRDGEEVWVEVTDNGQGIAVADLPHIFDPFFTTKPLGQGTGLGLSVAYGIVQQHHGRIEVRSEPGRGAAFRVWLPMAQPIVEPALQPTGRS